MSLRVLFIIAIIFAVAAGQGYAAPEPVISWNFDTADDALGWSSAGGKMRIGDGAMRFTGPTCRMISPVFDLNTSPWQLLEIEIKTNKSGVARLFFSDTTEEPYGGFREKWHRHINMIGDGQYHKYTILPCWHEMGKIIHIRLDPPGTENAIKSIRIIDLKPHKATDSAWLFTKARSDWAAISLENESIEADGWRIKGDQNALALSPEIDKNAGDIPKLTLRAASNTSHNVLFYWLGAKQQQLHSVPIEIRGDGKLHSYVLDLSRLAEWEGKIIGVGLSPADGLTSREITLRSLSLGKTATGPAELIIKRVTFVDPIPRAGQRAKLRMELANIGGTAARDVEAKVTLVGGGSAVILPNKSTKTISADRATAFEWETELKTPGTVTAVASVGASNAEVEKYQAKLRIYPRFENVTRADYVPEPVIANTGDYLVGCYYFPGWRDYSAWSVLNDFPERRPVLGYAHNGNPEVVDWQINWALSHGIGFFIYDWYWHKGSRGLEEGLHDGFLKSRYQDKMQFCLLWANHNDPGSHSEEDMLAVTRFWIDNYFKRDNYLKVDGKNVIVIFSPYNISSDMGNEAVRPAFEKMRKLCEEAGVGGLYFVACGRGDAAWVKGLEDQGYDAISGYNYPSAGDRGQNVAPYAWMVDAYKDIWNEIGNAASIPYIPLCEAGWDARPWHGPGSRVRSGKSALLWQKMLSNAKQYCDSPAQKLPGSKKIVFLEAWNEFGEGDYIEPNAGDGFEYLEAIRNVFAPTYNGPVALTPKDVGLGPYDIPTPVLQSAWNFAKPADRIWTAGGMTTPVYDSGNLRSRSTTRDPILSAGWAEINADRYKIFEIRMKINKPDEAQLFFKANREALSESKSVRFALQGDNNFHTYHVDMSTNPRWNGTITGLRFDPANSPDVEFEIEYMRFLPEGK